MSVLTVIFTLIATVGHDQLPIVMQGGDYLLLVKKGISQAVWVLTLVAMLLPWRREQRVMDLWLILVMWIWLFDIALSRRRRIEPFRSRLLRWAAMHPHASVHNRCCSITRLHLANTRMMPSEIRGPRCNGEGAEPLL